MTIVEGVIIGLLAGPSALILGCEWFREQDLMMQRRIDAVLDDKR